MSTLPSAPGWYDDPQGVRRWWDGQRWGAYAPWAAQADGQGATARSSTQLDRRYLRDTTASGVPQAVVHHVHHAPAKELTVAYLLLLFLGTLGAHRFYLGRNGTAIAMLSMTLIGALLSIVLVGIPLLFAVSVWWFVDLFLTPGMVREENRRHAMQAGQPGYYRGWPPA